jgi:hypothetical protein
MYEMRLGKQNTSTAITITGQDEKQNRPQQKILPGDVEDRRLPHVMQRREEGLSGKC